MKTSKLSRYFLNAGKICVGLFLTDPKRSF